MQGGGKQNVKFGLPPAFHYPCNSKDASRTNTEESDFAVHVLRFEQATEPQTPLGNLKQHRFHAKKRTDYGKGNPLYRKRLRIQRPAGCRNPASAGQRDRSLESASDEARPSYFRLLRHLSERSEVRRPALRASALRLSGRDAGLPGAGAGYRHRRQRRSLSAERMGVSLPSRPDSRHVARTQHSSRTK